MAATVPVTFPSTTLGTSAAAIITGATGGFTKTQIMVFTNTTASAVTISVYNVPSAGTPVTGNLVVSGLTLPPNTVNGGAVRVFQVENLTIPSGGTLQALASSGSAVNFTGSGVYQTT